MTVRVDLTVVPTKRSGAVAGTPVGGTSTGQCFKNDGRVFLRVENTDASPHTMTVRGRVTPDNDQAVVCAANDFTFAGPFSPGKYNKQSGDNGDTPAVSLKGRVVIDFEGGAETDFNVEAYRLP
jgi:hypothetical protein